MSCRPHDRHQDPTESADSGKMPTNDGHRGVFSSEQPRDQPSTSMLRSPSRAGLEGWLKRRRNESHGRNLCLQRDAVAAGEHLSVAQQRPDVEVEHLVYDGGSTDGSVEWLREHTSLGYEAIVGPDGGQTDALAKGFARGTGEIFAWLNADDLLEPGALRRVVDVFTADPGLVMVTATCLIIDSQGAVIGAIPVPPVATLTGLLSLPTTLPQPATFFSAEAYRRAGGCFRRGRVPSARSPSGCCSVRRKGSPESGPRSGRAAAHTTRSSLAARPRTASPP